MNASEAWTWTMVKTEVRMSADGAHRKLGARPKELKP